MQSLVVIKNVLDIFHGYKKLIESTTYKKVARSLVKELYRPEKLTSEFFNQNIGFGEIVKVKGVISNYSYLYKPVPFSPTISAFGRVSKEVAHDKNGKLSFNVSESFTSRMFNFPVQKLPAFSSSDGKKYKILFIYPDNMNGFLFDEDLNTGRDDNFKITRAHMCIPIKLPIEQASNIEGRQVEVEAILAEPDSKVLKELNGRLCNTRRVLNSGFIDEYSVGRGFVLDGTGEVLNIKELGELESLRAAIYVEGAMSNVQDFDTDKLKVIYGKAVDKDFHFKFSVKDTNSINYINRTNVSVVGNNECNTIGFYIDTDLKDNNLFHANLKELQAVYKKFHTQATGLIRNDLGVNAKFNPNFMFDFDRQGLFHGDGVLSSREVDKIIQKNGDLSVVTDWFRQ